VPLCVLQEAEENKGATRWPEYYIDQLRSMAAVSNTAFILTGTLHFTSCLSLSCGNSWPVVLRSASFDQDMYI